MGDDECGIGKVWKEENKCYAIHMRILRRLLITIVVSYLLSGFCGFALSMLEPDFQASSWVWVLMIYVPLEMIIEHPILSVLAVTVVYVLVSLNEYQRSKLPPKRKYWYLSWYMRRLITNDNDKKVT